jgi:hypothetical protein
MEIEALEWAPRTNKRGSEDECGLPREGSGLHIPIIMLARVPDRPNKEV